MEQTRVLIVEDEGLFRDALRIALSAHADVEVVGIATDGAEAILLATELLPQVVLMDIDLGCAPNGIEAGHRIRETNSDMGIVLLSMHRDKQYIAALPKDRVSGWSYLLKQNLEDTAALVRAIQGSALGLVVMDAAIIQALRPRAGGRIDGLSPRQLEVLQLIAQGYNNVGIAERLVISEKSVENNINVLFQELEIPRQGPINPRVMAVLAYLEETRG